MDWTPIIVVGALVAFFLLLPPRWDPAIRIKERQMAAGTHPEASSALHCRPGKPYGIHGEVLYGLGGMGDASLCLRCGLDTYARIWPRESIREVKAPEDWPAIEAARKLGLENN